MTLQEIVAAAKHLKPAPFVQLQKQLDQLERRLWKSELASANAKLRSIGIDDRQIDKMVERRRRSTI
jgi:hypothetical protein